MFKDDLIWTSLRPVGSLIGIIAAYSIRSSKVWSFEVLREPHVNLSTLKCNTWYQGANECHLVNFFCLLFILHTIYKHLLSLTDWTVRKVFLCAVLVAYIFTLSSKVWSTAQRTTSVFAPKPHWPLAAESGGECSVNHIHVAEVRSSYWASQFWSGVSGTFFLIVAGRRSGS